MNIALLPTPTLLSWNTTAFRSIRTIGFQAHFTQCLPSRQHFEGAELNTMVLTQSKLFRVLLGPLLFLTCLLVLGESYRNTARFLLIPLLASYVYFLWT